MFTLVVCLFIACLLPFISKIPLGIAMKEQAGGYNNRDPRAQQALLTGWGARASAAHKNSFESLIIFSTAALTAIATQHTGHLVQTLAIVYIVSRGIYHCLYLLDWSTLRTLCWLVGYVASLTILGMCIPG